MLSSFLALILIMGLAVVPAHAADTGTKQVEAGMQFSLFVTEDGDLYGCGYSSCKELGRIPTTYDSGAGHCATRPQYITDNVDMVAATRFHSGGVINHILVLKEDGRLYGMGSNVTYQLGFEEKGQYDSLQYIMDDVKYIAAGYRESAALTENGDLYWWGRNTTPEPRLLMKNVKQMELGKDHIVVLKEDGSVWTRGVARNGALGNGQASGSSEEFIYVTDGCIDVSAGTQSTMVVKANGDLYGWGQNYCGNVGVSKNIAYDSYGDPYVSKPTYVTSNVRDVECGNDTCFLIKTDNTLYGMGWNGDSQMGNASQANLYSPTWLASNVEQVSAGADFTLIKKTNGSTYGCGRNYNYELGAGFSQYNVGTWQPAGFTASPIFDGKVTFSDVTEDLYCYAPVSWAVERYITNGTSVDTFSPNSTCTRAQILTFLWRANGCDRPINSFELTDVPWHASYYQACYWARSQGMIPYSGKVNPTGACTRAMAVEFMWKNAGSPAYNTSSLPFTDVSPSASYAQAVAWALDQGITTGKTATTFAPNATCTRGQIVTFLYRAMT